MKSTIFICDDYGLDNSTNLAIKELCLANKVDGFSVLITHLKGSISKELIDNYQVGLHLNLTEGDPTLSPSLIPSLLNANGEFKSLTSLIFGLTIGTVKKEEVKAEIVSQLNSFRNRITEVSHIDGHQHIQYHPIIFTILKDCIRELRLDNKMRIRHSYFRNSSFNIKYFILNILYFINTYKNKSVIYKKYIIDYKSCLKSHSFSLENTELFLHVAHPSLVSDSHNTTTFQYMDRVNQYHHRLGYKEIK